MSPLLSNVYLDPLDKELKKRGHRFVRYADDCKIFVKTKRSGERVLSSIRKYKEKILRLKMNEKKSGVSKGCPILGFIVNQAGIRINPEAIKRLKERVRNAVRIRGGKAIQQVIKELRPILEGWNAYYKIQTRKSVYKEINSWIRRRIRAMLYKRYKNGTTHYQFFKAQGISEHVSYTCAYSNYGPWGMALSKPMRVIYNGRKLSEMGLYTLVHLR